MAKKRTPAERRRRRWRHVCPPWCHLCPLVVHKGQECVMPMCMGTAASASGPQDLRSCTCSRIGGAS